MINELFKKNRSHRSFIQESISPEVLEKLISTTTFASSAKNSQSLRYTLVSDINISKKIFPFTAWAGAISWNPTIDEAPTAYILVSSGKNVELNPVTLGIDIGIATQNILLKATSLGINGCIIGAFNKNSVSELLNLDTDKYTPHILIALGKAKDVVEIIPGTIGNLKYSRDIENNKHFVPKLNLKDIILKTF